jgi:predicted nucleic acid-binding protein
LRRKNWYRGWSDKYRPFTKNGVISTQVLKEFFVTVTQKIPKKLDPVDSKEIIKKFALLEVVETNVPLVLHGIDIHREKQGFKMASVFYKTWILNPKMSKNNSP